MSQTPFIRERIVVKKLDTNRMTNKYVDQKDFKSNISDHNKTGESR